jgi:hypothetical protein
MREGVKKKHFGAVALNSARLRASTLSLLLPRIAHQHLRYLGLQQIVEVPHSAPGPLSHNALTLF